MGDALGGVGFGVFVVIFTTNHLHVNYKGNWGLITGASKGLGRALAHALARRGFSLVLTARSGDLLENLGVELRSRYGVEVHCLALDISSPGAGGQLVDFCAGHGVEVRVVVNNAGAGVWERFGDADLGAMMRVNALNVDAVVRISHAFLPMLRRQKRAWILNVASTGAYQPIPCMALYGAGKAYVRSFSHALRHELRSSGVSVSCLSPGGVWTEFMRTAGNEVVSERNRMFMMSAERCAEAAVRGMLRGRAEIIPGWYNRVAAVTSKWMPTRFSTAAAARIFNKV